jgi:acyl-CoA dehydrogenase
MATSPSTATSEPTVGFEIPAELREVLDRVRAFVEEVVLPAEAEVGNAAELLASWHVVERLRDAARQRGIYVPHLPSQWGGLGIGPLGMALISQECGVSALASLGLNAMAPDEGNMHTLLVAGSDEQKERYLRPLAEGRVRSCFAMTEPDVAGSDPTGLRTTAVRHGEEWVINGRKWCISGADGAAFAIVVARTGDDDGGHRNHSMILVPTDTPGWTIVNAPQFMGGHSPGGHPEIELRDVRVPLANLLGAEGEGFAIAQKRLAGGRLAHAMRWIGVSQRALDLTARRLLEREAFGKPLAEHQALQFLVADSAIDLYASRLMVLHAAWKLEQGLPHRQEIAMVKTFVSEAFGRIADRAVQVFGSHGIATDLPIAGFYTDARAARIYDGPSEVHRAAIARACLRLASEGKSTKAACGDLA